ncbi:hypothetical protein SAMN05444920_11899 [Nonomuraea solani]|uniref:Uncharacterized protein n=1 Tax=Nonomuraea solani TaxID=1144553 RepID=A0A1H6ESS2_9ACTN|nr:hypothetical protein [Nonomuraea solani]SEH00910.1 hypothetical protein SAMN05444920_11899 [Nonomuraea solani]
MGKVSPATPPWLYTAGLNMGAGLLNSAIIALSTAAGVCVISGCAAYTLARLDLPRPGLFILYLLAVSSLPIQLFLEPAGTAVAATPSSRVSPPTGRSSARPA